VYKQPSPKEGLVQADNRGVHFLPLSGNVHSPTFISFPFPYMIPSLKSSFHAFPLNPY
jgi:hypothetical protein